MARTGAVRSARFSSASLRPETELLLLLARTRPAPEVAPRVTALLKGRLDWIFLLREARSQGVLPLVYVRLKAARDGLVPEDILGQLGGYFDQHVRRNERLVAELLRLLALLNAQSIPALTFKGAPLAVAAYGDLSLREFSDLDFLIRRRDLPRARDVFLRAGYRLKSEVDERGLPFDPESYEYTFVRDDDGTIAELHWRLTPLHLRASLDLEHLQGRRQFVTFNEAAVPTLLAEDALLVLCVHGDKHRWCALKLICDVAELLRASPRLDWRHIETDARRLGCWRMVALGLHLASDLLGAPVPDGVLDRVRKDAHVSRAAGRVHRDLFEDEAPGAGTDKVVRPYHRLQLLERPSDWGWNAVVLVRRAFTVSPTDKKLLALPGPLRFGYYPLRCARLLLKYGLIPFVNRVRPKTRTTGTV